MFQRIRLLGCINLPMIAGVLILGVLIVKKGAQKIGRLNRPNQ
jgi:hypothetical protein